MGVIFLLLAACLWGTIGPVSRLVFQQGVTPLETAFWRGGIAGTAYLLHFLVMRRSTTAASMPLSPKLIPWIILFGIFGVALLEGSYVYAVHIGGGALASVLLYSAPIWVNLVGWKFFGEYISTKQKLALTMTTLGIAGICLWGAPIHLSGWAILWGLLSGVSYALFYLCGRIFFRSSHPVSVYMIAFPVASLAILPVIYFLEGHSPMAVMERFVHLPPSAMIPLIAIGLFATYLPYILHGFGLKRVDSGKAAILTMIEPVVSIALSHVMWGETFSMVGYACAAVVIFGVILAG